MFVEYIKNDAVKLLSAADKERLKPILEAKPQTNAPQPAPPRPFVKEWKMDELLPMVQNRMRGRDFDHETVRSAPDGRDRLVGGGD